jgi:hypothetical protein
MGLDMYAYVAKKENELREYYDSYDYNTDSGPVVKPREIAYWRKSGASTLYVDGWTVYESEADPDFCEDPGDLDLSYMVRAAVLTGDGWEMYSHSGDGPSAYRAIEG